MSSGFGGIVLRYFQHLFYLYLLNSLIIPLINAITHIFYLSFQTVPVIYASMLVIICGVSPLAALLALTVFQKKITA